MQRRYRRFFVILENEDTDIKAQQPKGHAKFEIKNEKGILTLNCQSLKALKEKNVRYRWYMLNTKNEEPIVVDIGPMEADVNGKGELTWEFIADNVKASKSSIDQFNMIVLLAEAIGDKKTFEAPLIGYIDKDQEKLNWKGLLERKLNGEFTSVAKKPLQWSLEAIKEEAKPLESKGAKEVKEANVKEEVKGTYSFEEFSEEFRKNITEVEKQLPKGETIIPVGETANPVKEAINPVKEAINPVKEVASPTKDSVNPVKEALGPIKDTAQPLIQVGSNSIDKMGEVKETVQKDTVQVYIESTLKMFPQVYPFEENLKNYQWWQLPYNYQTMYRAYMPFIAYIEGMRYPNYYFPYQYPSEYQRLIYMHQHYIFGICYNQDKKVKYYVYGIPGRRVVTDQPYGGTTGFVYWHSCNKSAQEGQTQGYWLMHVDPEAGKIITPLETTKL